MPSAFGSQRSARTPTSASPHHQPATSSTYTAIRHGAVLAEATVSPGRSHDVAWSAANVAWSEAAARGG